jgi:hypothetical protein
LLTSPVHPREPGIANMSDMNFCAANDGSRVGHDTCAADRAQCCISQRPRSALIKPCPAKIAGTGLVSEVYSRKSLEAGQQAGFQNSKPEQTLIDLCIEKRLSHNQDQK